MPPIYTRRGDKGTTDTWGGGRIRKTNNLIAAIGAIDSLNSTIGVAYEHIRKYYKSNSRYVKRLSMFVYFAFVILMLADMSRIRDPYMLYYVLFDVFIICMCVYVTNSAANAYKYSCELMHELDVIMNLNFALSSVIAELPSNNKTLTLPDFTEELEACIDYYDSKLPPLRNFILPRGNNIVAALHQCRTATRIAERELWLLAENTDLKIDDELHTYMNRLSDYFFNASRYVMYKEKLPEVLVETPTPGALAD